jgi:hypothetical protein
VDGGRAPNRAGTFQLFFHKNLGAALVQVIH